MSIISINGKISSGKDTVGKIIQYLTLPGERGEYIGFETYDDATLERNSPFKVKKFAGKLKQIGSLLTGVPVEKFEDQEFKKQQMNPEWNMTYREFLQKLGTEAMRDGLHTNVWVNALFADYKLSYVKGLVTTFNNKLPEEYPNWIITDMRFPNEMEAVEEREGITIRVVREFYQFVDTEHEWSDREDRQGNVLRANATYSKEESNRVWRNSLKERAHASETALDDADFDYEIINDGSIEDLVEKVREILIKENII